jgi:hypothetical protein
MMARLYTEGAIVQGGSNMTGTRAACLHTNQSRSYLNHLVYLKCILPFTIDEIKF